MCDVEWGKKLSSPERWGDETPLLAALASYHGAPVGVWSVVEGQGFVTPYLSVLCQLDTLFIPNKSDNRAMLSLNFVNTKSSWYLSMRCTDALSPSEVQAEKEQAEADKVQAEKLQAEADKVQAEKEQAAKLQAEADKVQAEKLQAAKLQAEADKVQADKEQAEKLRADKEKVPAKKQRAEKNSGRRKSERKSPEDGHGVDVRVMILEKSSSITSTSYRWWDVIDMPGGVASCFVFRTGDKLWFRQGQALKFRPKKVTFDLVISYS